MNNKLTAKQEKFCQAIAEGKTQYDAFKIAYAPKYKDNAIYVNASRLLNNTKIQLRIDELKKAVEKKYLWTRELSVKILGSIALRRSANDNSKVSAIRELNLMHGFNGNPTDDDYVEPVTVTIQVQSAKRTS